MFSGIEQWLKREDSKEVVSDTLLGCVRVKVQKLKASVKETIDVRPPLVISEYTAPRCYSRLYTRMLPMVDQVLEALERFGSLKLLNR